MKFVCPRCRESKGSENFRWSKGRRQPYCIPCNKAYQREHYKRNKAAYKVKALDLKRKHRATIQRQIWSYLENHPCVDCGESDPIVLDFDHVDRETKSASVSRFVSNAASWERILEEITKCVVRCRNCHQRRTARQFGWYAWREQGPVD